jgi:hypothetical protein
MGRWGSYPTILDELKEFDISFLSKHHYLIPNNSKIGGITWTYANGNKNNIEIKTDINKTDGVIVLRYTFNDTEKIDYQIRLITRPSNLGTGLIWFFLCPFTDKVCRRLHLINGYFKHRSALSNDIYQSQIESKKWRVWSKYICNDNLYSELYSKSFKRYYNGKPTKRYLRLTKIVESEKEIDFLEFNKMLFKK